MALTKITEADLVNKGVVGLPDTPGLSTSEMQEKFDEIALDVIVPKHNTLVDELEDLGVESKVGSDTITNIRTNADMAIEVSTDGGETYVGTASSGHRIEDGNGYIYPNRSRLQFSSNVTITDNPEGNATFLSVANGEKGDKGDAATIAIGTVESGVTPAVTNTGSNTDAIFNFTFPKGDAGSAATVQVGTVTSGANASVTNRGTSSAAILDFTLPKGDQGDPGTGLTILASYNTLSDLQSAHPTGQRGDAYYVEANEHVYIWDVDNLAWEDIGAIKGAKGDTGSAATITVGTVTTGATASVVNSGTTSAAVLDFVLQKGDKGDTGNTGTIAVGSVTSGVTASVTNSGTSTAAVFDFVLPKGDKGDKGDPGNAILPHFRITSDHGSTVTITKGAIEVAAVETSSGIYEADVPEYGTYTVTSVYSGQTTTKTVDVDTVKVYTTNVSIPVGTIIVTYPVGATCTCVGQGESYTATANPETFTVYHLGTFVITVSKDGDTASENVTITTQGQSESITIDLIPDGSTVTPTDDVQTWLKCAGIKDKTTYTTLSDVLADSVTFNALLGDSNACAYMARCETWAEGLVPKMTSNTTPSGTASAKSVIDSSHMAYMAFDGNVSTFWESAGESSTDIYVQYEFANPVTVKALKHTVYKDSNSSNQVYRLVASNDNFVSDTNTLLAETTQTTYVDSQSFWHSFENTTAYKYYRFYVTNGVFQGSYYSSVRELQLYAADICITDNQYAMNLIGQYDVCCDALLGNSTWASAIVASAYADYVLSGRGLVPIMTSDTTPSGVASASSVLTTGYEAYLAFDDNVSTAWHGVVGVPQWIEYQFPTAVNVKLVTLKTSTAVKGPKTSKIQYYDGSDWVDYSNDASFADCTTANTLYGKAYSTNINATRFRLYVTESNYTHEGNQYVTFAELQFYGATGSREYIHGTYNETAYYLDGATQVPISNPSTLDAGTYTFGSTVAKNPDSLATDYTKSIRITPNTVEVVLRPDKSLYWYGYKSSNSEIVSTSNGWSVESYTNGTVTENQQNISLSTASHTFGGFGNKSAISFTKGKCIYTGVSDDSGSYGHLMTTSTKAYSASNRTIFSSSGLASYEITNTSDSYLCVEGFNGAGGNIHALWYE